MREKLLGIVSIVCLSFLVSPATSDVSAAPDTKNVLFICIDDLRPVLGSYGGDAKTPHLDRFAESAVQFNRHYVQFPSCGPSRASMFSGMRPDTFDVYGNGGAWVISKNPENQPTMPRYFRDNGYTTLSFGKTYHGKGTGKGYGWSRTPWHPPSGWTCFVNHKYEGKGTVRPAYEIYDGADSLHGDYQTADQAIAALKENRDKPFFIAAGFYKPHLPFVAPRKYWDLYNPDEIKRLEPLTVPDGAAQHGYAFREITTYGYTNGQEKRYYKPDSLPTDAQARELIRAYYAAVSFNDAQVGRLLGALDELGLSESTAVVVWSDHGFHLGDQARWAKWTQFESDMRSPMMIRMPHVDQKTRKTDALVESIDLYPTLADYCGLPRPDHLEGESLLPLIRGVTDHAKPFALSQVKGLQSEGNMLAYSVRNQRYRYVEWRDTKQDHRLVSCELYDLGTIGSETVNIAADPDNQEIVESCHQAVLAGYSSLRSFADGELK